MSLVALVSDTLIPTAMFADREGLGHIVNEGARVRGGYVFDIRDNEVELALTGVVSRVAATLKRALGAQRGAPFGSLTAT